MKIERPEELLLQIVKILDNLKISYMVTGGFALAVLAKPRFTADIGIVIKIELRDIQKLAKKTKGNR